jgi:pilus assembly protein CpaB
VRPQAIACRPDGDSQGREYWLTQEIGPMTRMRVILVLLVAIAAGGGLAYGTYNYVRSVPAAAASVPTRPVVVATNDLSVGSALRLEDVRVIEWPASSLPAGVFDKTDDVIGRGLVMPVIQNEPLLPMKLASKDAGSGLPIMIPEGERAMSVRVNEVIGVAGYVLPGTRVDIVAVASATDNKADTTSKVVLTNVQVLAAGTKMEEDGEKGGKPMPVSVVTLLVDPDQAERLTLASTEGKIQLALRNPLDQGSPTTVGVRAAGLLGDAPVAKPVGPVRARVARPAVVLAAATPVEPSVTVEMIRGDKRSEEVVR